MKPKGILLHTVGVNGDTTIGAIRRYHVEHNGWRDVGYHFLIRKNGAVEPGRAVTSLGAHATGANDTIGICVAGNGDSEPWTLAQRDAVVKLCADQCRIRGFGPDRIGGHREAQAMFGGAATSKTCPGKLVDMSAVRAWVAAELARPVGAKAGL
jgi:hypothetical protein